GSIAVIHGCAGNRNQLRRIAAIERQIDDALLIDDLGYRVLLRLNETGVGRDLNPLRHRTNPHGDVDLDMITDPENQAVLDICLKSGHSGFETVGSYRQTWEGVDTIRIGNCLVNRAGIYSSHFDLGAGHQRTLRICDMAGYRSDRNGLCMQ